MPASLDQLKSEGVCFHLAGDQFDPGYRHYASACLASGLKRMGIPVFANLASTRFDGDGQEGARAALHVFEVEAEANSPELYREALACAAREKFLLSRADATGMLFPPAGIPSLMAHENRFRPVKGTRLPWAFGLSDEIMAATAEARPFLEREPTILRNFSRSANQHVRDLLDWALVPHLARHFKVDTRPGRDHCDRLTRYAGCLAYGGTWETDLLESEHFQKNEGYREYRNVVSLKQPVVLLRWDSWRWWESLSAGCLTFQLDLGKYGLLLPVLPEPWVHYVPVDLTDPKATVERLLDERPRWGQIAAAGREWARTHFSPDAVARRLVDYAAPTTQADLAPKPAVRPVALQVPAAPRPRRGRRIYATFGGEVYDTTTGLIVMLGPKLGADEVWVYDDKWLMSQRPEFVEHNRWLWDHPHKRGFGWYAWKPFILLDAFEHLEDGDIVLYTDADTFPVNDFSVLYDICAKDGGIMLFKAGGNVRQRFRQHQWCKRDCFVVMNQDEEKYRQAEAGVARFMLFQKGSWRAHQFLMEWLTYCVNPRATTFDPSVIASEVPGYIEHRTEQAIMTNLAHKYGLKLYREACELGNSFPEDQELYPQLFSQANPWGNKTAPCVGSKFANRT